MASRDCRGAISFSTVGDRSSHDADVGYTYGEFQRDDKPRRGWYVRLWTRDPRADWKVLIEAFVPLPPR